MTREGWSTVVCAATGPSFTQAQADVITAAQAAGRCRVAVVNDAWGMLPTADLLYSANKWFDQYIADIRFCRFRGELWTQDQAAALKYSLQYIRSAREPGLNRTPGVINQGNTPDGYRPRAHGNGAYQLAGLLYHFGVRRMIWVGLDMQRTGGKAHYFGEHPATLSRVHAFPEWIYTFGILADDLERAGVDVLNCSASTALHCFRRAALADALSETVSV